MDEIRIRKKTAVLLALCVIVVVAGLLITRTRTLYEMRDVADSEFHVFLLDSYIADSLFTGPTLSFRGSDYIRFEWNSRRVEDSVAIFVDVDCSRFRGQETWGHFPEQVEQSRYFNSRKH
jgi:hypothetical protein